MITLLDSFMEFLEDYNISWQVYQQEWKVGESVTPRNKIIMDFLKNELEKTTQKKND